MPWRAMNRMLRRICSSCFRVSAFSLACPADSVSSTSRVTGGKRHQSLDLLLVALAADVLPELHGTLFPVGEAVTYEPAVHLPVADLARLLGRHAEMAERKVPALKIMTLME
ncbi:hypothetical protein DPMN_170090 [Dreissena polymorpha]|uniref:Uncharacterized protein n=1 Tax=Dreissena polymorpha TaxID=45954 RepID=A0A9D4ICW1_DREPO|nr:hypothetical protein DPMN_170090 [Dreissena polymorpha]